MVLARPKSAWELHRLTGPDCITCKGRGVTPHPDQGRVWPWVHCEPCNGSGGALP